MVVTRHGDGERVGGIGTRPLGAPRAELQQVVEPAGLGATADARALPTAEGLAPHDRPGGVAIHVCVADLDPLQPAVGLGGVERVDAAGQAELDGVLELDGVVEIGGPHQPENRPEALGAVEPRSGRRHRP